MKSIRSPFDPFQGGSIASDPVQHLARRWVATILEYDATQDDDGCVILWARRKAIEAQIFAMAESSVAGAALKLRVLAYHVQMLETECANGDGVTRSNPLTPDEEMLASALADLERLARSG
jgi:hypothetical protein